MRSTYGLLPAIVVLVTAHAQDTDTVPRATAFLSSLKGEVSIVSGADARVVDGAVNARVMSGDRVVTGSYSHADIRFESGDVFRAGSDTELLFARMENGHYELQLAK